jgi:hypothetical protein
MRFWGAGCVTPFQLLPWALMVCYFVDEFVERVQNERVVIVMGFDGKSVVRNE